MGNQTPNSWFQENITKYNRQGASLEQKFKQVSLWRLLAFVLFLTLFAVCVSSEYWPGLALVCLTFLFGFGWLINFHNRIKHQKDLCDQLVKQNQHELKRLVLELALFADGSSYLDEKHPYCVDLDLFGPHSLFQWINRTVSKGGEQILASALLNPAPIEELPSRQAAVRELSGKPDWCQQLQANGLVHKGHLTDTDSFIQWVTNPMKLPAWFKPALMVLPLISVGLTIAFFTGAIMESIVLIPLIVNGFLLSKVQKLAAQTYQHTYQSIGTLRSFEAMIDCVERTEFRSDLLVDLREAFLTAPQYASAAIKQLKDILSRIETRNNPIYWIFNIYFLLDLIYLIQSESWKSKNGKKVVSWFASLSQFEFLASLGCTAYSQPGSVFPTMVEDPYQFQAEALGHPLIPHYERVCNDFSLADRGTTGILTGSNMSGKSTFLRTLGVNVVLARMGSTVCARKLHLGDFHLFTSMRTTDSLKQHVSSFYAELERIRQLIQLVEAGLPVMFLLDELLKGTNSEDRHTGSAALVKQLSKANAFGLISTHDLSLGRLAEQRDQLVNYSFNCQLIDGTLHFDYKLQPGICVSFNATELMAQMGIALDHDQPSV